MGENAAWFGNDVKEELTLRNGQEDLDLTSRKNVDFIRNLSLLEDLLILIIEVLTQNDGQLIKDVFMKIQHELNILKLLSLPSPVDVIIREEVLLEG